MKHSLLWAPNVEEMNEKQTMATQTSHLKPTTHKRKLSEIEKAPWNNQQEKLPVSLHYKNTPIQIYRKFHLQKRKSFR